MSDGDRRFVSFSGWSLGALLAFLVLVAVFVLRITDKMSTESALLLGALAASRLC